MNSPWKIKYKEMLEDVDISYEEIHKFIHPYIPKKIYRYRRFDEYYLDNIKGNVFLSYASKFNDPFDSAIEIDYVKYVQEFFRRKSGFSIDISEINNLFKDRTEIKEEFDKHYNDTYNNFQGYVRIASFTTSFDNRLMWSHYAGEHTGFCIEYDLNNESFIKNTILPVVYSEERFDCTECLLTHSKNTAINPVFFKDVVWQYENEWRIYGTKAYFEYNKNPIDVSKIITAIYLGAKSDENSLEVNKVKQFCLEKQIPLYKMEMSQKKYELYYRLINER